MTKQRIHVQGARVLIHGLAFKEYGPHLRNTKVVNIINELRECHMHVDVHDPSVDPREVQSEFGKAEHVFFDIKGLFPVEASDLRL